MCSFLWLSKFTAAAAAKSPQSCPTLCDPIDGSPPGSAVPGILQARTLEWVAISFSSAWKRKVKGKLLSHVWLLATPWTTAYQAPPSMGFSRQEYWNGVPLPSPNCCRLCLLIKSIGHNVIVWHNVESEEIFNLVLSYREICHYLILIIYNVHIYSIWWFSNMNTHSFSLFPMRGRIVSELGGFLWVLQLIESWVMHSKTPKVDGWNCG